VKLVIEEPESRSLDRHLAHRPELATSRIALVEVLRATAIANPAPEVRAETKRLLSSCMLVDLGEEILRNAAELASASIRTLDAIHLASALRIEADEVLVYDRRLAAAADGLGLSVASPGRPSGS
jgi:predicted nucleic acid-binding protein